MEVKSTNVDPLRIDSFKPVPVTLTFSGGLPSLSNENDIEALVADILWPTTGDVVEKLRENELKLEGKY